MKPLAEVWPLVGERSGNRCEIHSKLPCALWGLLRNLTGSAKTNWRGVVCLGGAHAMVH